MDWGQVSTFDDYATRLRRADIRDQRAEGIFERQAERWTVGIVDIALYRDDLSKVAPQAVLRSSDIPFGVDNMDLVLVDDVLYTGRTIRAAMNGLFDLGRPKRVSLCVLIERGHREMPIEAQYIGRSVQTSDTEIIEVRLREIDKEERVVLVDRVE